MVSKEHAAVDAGWIERARELAGRHAAAAEVLKFYARLAGFQNELMPRASRFETLAELAPVVSDFTVRCGTAQLQELARSLTRELLSQAIDNYWHKRDTRSPVSFFARVVLQPWAVRGASEPVTSAENLCPRCGQAPQVAVLRPHGHGSRLALVCSLCLHEWEFRRLCCVSCLETDNQQLDFFVAEQLDAFQLQLCRTCNAYIHCIEAGRDVLSVPFVDEMAALPLDWWAREQGFQKLQPNLAGI